MSLIGKSGIYFYEAYPFSIVPRLRQWRRKFHRQGGPMNKTGCSGPNGNAEANDGSLRRGHKEYVDLRGKKGVKYKCSSISFRPFC